MTAAGRHGPRNGRPPTLSPHLCCSLPWDSVPSGGSSALPPPCQEPAGGVPSPLTPHITFLPARQASVQGPAVTSHPPLRGLLCGAGGGGRVRRLPPRAAIETEAVTAASVSPEHPGAASCPAHRCVSIIGKGAGAFTY